VDGIGRANLSELPKPTESRSQIISGGLPNFDSTAMSYVSKSIIWAEPKGKRLPNASLKLRQLSFLEREFLSQASMLSRSKGYAGAVGNKG
jgi:hypothetical protein